VSEQATNTPPHGCVCDAETAVACERIHSIVTMKRENHERVNEQKTAVYVMPNCPRLRVTVRKEKKVRDLYAHMNDQTQNGVKKKN
jgi:hypothetical protein